MTIEFHGSESAWKSMRSQCGSDPERFSDEPDAENPEGSTKNAIFSFSIFKQILFSLSFFHGLLNCPHQQTDPISQKQADIKAVHSDQHCRDTCQNQDFLAGSYFPEGGRKYKSQNTSHESVGQHPGWTIVR